MFIKFMKYAHIVGRVFKYRGESWVVLGQSTYYKEIRGYRRESGGGYQVIVCDAEFVLNQVSCPLEQALLCPQQ